MSEIRRYCELNNLPEITDLEYGDDFRMPIFRREVFLRLYEFHLKYGTHPGLVYMLMPYLAKRFGWTMEQKLWFAFINGCTQNPCTSWVVFTHFPDFEKITEEEFEKWHRENWKLLDFDIDRRYIKGHLVEMWVDYKKNLGSKTQVEFFEELCSTNNPFLNFYSVWDKVMKDFNRFGRLSTFSYLEYLKIMGLNLDCPELFFEDLPGSKSHRNGILKVCGRDDLDWYKDNPGITTHGKDIVQFATDQAQILLLEAKTRFKGKIFEKDVNYFTLESTLCCYKSHFRVNRRYPNVYTDMNYDRIKKAQRNWQHRDDLDFQVFWDARTALLPSHLLIECNPNDPGLAPIKQNHFRLTGQMIMLDKEWDCFRNDFNDKYSSV